MEKYIFDVILVAIVALIIALSAKKGFTASLLSTVSVVLSGFLSYKFTEPVSEFIYSSFLRGKIEEKFTEVLSSLSTDVSFNGKINAMLGALPKGYVDVAQAFGLNVNSAIENSMQLDVTSNEQLIQLLIDNIAGYVVTAIVQLVVFLALFILLAIVFKFVSKLLNKIVEKLPVVGKANSILGGVLGFVKAVVFVFVTCTVICVLVNSTDIGLLKDFVSSSYIYRFVLDYNPLVNFI